MAKLNDPNGLMMAQLDTLHSLPLASTERYHVGEVYCETRFNSLDAAAVQRSCPRFMARDQLCRLRDLGYELFSAYEAEPLLLDGTTAAPLHHEYKYLYTDAGLVQHQHLLMEFARTAEDLGLKLEGFHMENMPGQHEFTTLPQLGIQAADNMFSLREIFKQTSRSHERRATFMTLPFDEFLSANGLHFNHSLRSAENNRPVFYDDSRDNKLSEVCEHWVAGILTHLGALTAICCPTVNCYRRICRAYAPSRSTWGIEDRNTTIRVKNATPESCYIESRIPSSSANPYLIIAATVAAGIDGITNKLQCPPTRSEGWEGSELPTTLDTALEALQNDQVLSDAFGAEFITWFTLLKKQEIDILGGSDVSDTSDERMQKERNLYMDLL